MAPLGLLLAAALTSAGFVLQTHGLKTGPTVPVCTMTTAAAMVTGVLVGLLALGETLPASWAMGGLRLLGWSCILLGLTSLAGAVQLLRGAAAAAAGRSPALARAAAAVPAPAAGAVRWVLAALEGDASHGV